MWDAFYCYTISAMEDGLNEVRFLLIWISVEHSSPGLEYLTLLRREPNNEPIDKEKEVRT